MKSTLVIALVYLLATSVLADVYMHNPRGSNDRLNEDNANRNNANRLFDSQNNAKGGYCLGPQMSFYEGSLLSIQWTNQHGCGNPKLYCNLVFQYMCTTTDAPLLERIRDGATTDTIPDDAAQAVTLDANGNPLFGMHESFQYYQDCKTRDRNKGLFIADREDEGNLNDGRASAIFTRQNNNGNRHGFECTEERDHYPYWHPAPWRDVAVLANDKKFCDFYKAESFNVKGRHVCLNNAGAAVAPNNEVECNQTGNVWTFVPPHNIAAPDCLASDFSRDNQLGSGSASDGANDQTYNWTLPLSAELPCIQAGNCQCVLRLRYNISASDLVANGKDGNAPDQDFIDSSSNAEASPVKQDPILPTAGGVEVQMAIDTSQFFRTFQDRSHVFSIIARPPGVGIARIFNLNVRGKRGNIVQAYPASEYDFVPSILHVRVGDYIHFQWTGCDNNPAGNAGEGTDKTDRHNIVQVKNFGRSYPLTDKDFANGENPMFDDPATRLFFAYLGQTNCPTQEQLLAQNGNNENAAKQDPANCFKLNAAPRYFNGGLIQMNRTGEYHYISTRNNNFTNRDQKGTLFVETVIPVWGIIVVAVGGAICLASGGVAAAMFYAKTHPHSGVAQMVSKF